LQGVLGIFQKLVASRVHDQEGFRILEALLDNLPLETLQPYMTEVGLPLFCWPATQI
jgi:exportin-2 (importin alpha re-exporter)